MWEGWQIATMMIWGPLGKRGSLLGLLPFWSLLLFSVSSFLRLLHYWLSENHAAPQQTHTYTSRFFQEFMQMCPGRAPGSDMTSGFLNLHHVIRVCLEVAAGHVLPQVSLPQQPAPAQTPASRKALLSLSLTRDADSPPPACILPQAFMYFRLVLFSLGQEGMNDLSDLICEMGVMTIPCSLGSHLSGP